MSAAASPLLFLSHAADRTGPPIYLRHFLRWLREHHPEVDFEIALLLGGELEDDFHALGRTTLAPDLPAPPWTDEQRAEVEVRRRDQMASHDHCRVVHVNAAPCAELARLLPPGDRVLLSHVHELEIGLGHWLPDADRRILLDDASTFFVPADAVRRNLAANHGIDPSRVALHPEMVDVREGAARPLSAEERSTGRVQRGLPADGLLVGMAGTIYWRKAFDLFLRMAWTVTRRHRTDPSDEPVTFVWVGGEPGAIGHAERLARQLGVDDVVRFVVTQPDPLQWFELMDVFVLPAREDPFPLVCLEAASVGVPLVAFDTGGMPELIEQGCGLVATYPDVGDLAAKVASLLADPALRTRFGDRGRELIRTRYDVSYLAPRLWADIERWL